MKGIPYRALASSSFLIGIALCVTLVLATGQLAYGDGAKNISAGAASTKAAAGEILIIDVRTAGEWRETGVPRGAARANIFESDFLERVKQAVGDDLSRPIAVICARGNRSTRAQQMLSAAGFKDVQNIREGMLGSAFGKGWLASAHPTEPCKDC